MVKVDNMSADKVPDIIKTEEDVRKIRQTVLSATSVQSYLACPASFYYGVVKGLEPENEVSESLDYGMFGTVFHDTMRAIYTSESAMSPDFVFDWKGENEMALADRLDRISRDYIQMWLSRKDDIKAKVNALIMRQLKSLEVSGRNLVTADVIVRYVMKTLKRDLELLKEAGRDSFDILGREMRVKGEFHGQQFKGFVDRIDSFAPGQARIVDYKTGKVLPEDENINDGNACYIAEQIFAPDVAERPKIAFQFYMYDLLIGNDDVSKDRTILNSVYSTANLFKEPLKTYPMNETFFNSVSEKLKALLDQMRDPSVPFRRTDDEKICSYCDFKTICGR
jgi:CRISPR/Cas system-associated exonuclease Cas4 (RecB family)